MNCDHAEKPVPLFRRSGGFKPTGHVETVPADDVVLDKPVAAFGNFLFDRVGMFETARVSDGDGPGETVREYRLVELPLDCLSQFDLNDIAQDEQGLDDLAEGFHGLVEAVLAGIRIQAPEYLGSRGFLELDRGDKAQQIIPGCSNHTFTDDRKGWRERSGFRSFPRGPSFCLPGRVARPLPVRRIRFRSWGRHQQRGLARSRGIQRPPASRAEAVRRHLA